jgi:hypothetical protein
VTTRATTLECPLCGFVTKKGLSVCRGCQGDIVEGPTFRELLSVFRFWLFFTLAVGVATLGLSLENVISFSPSPIAGFFFVATPLAAFAGVLGRCLKLSGKVRVLRRRRR